MSRPCTVVIFLLFFWLAGYPAAGHADLFYSGHLASYQNLENANRHVNQLKQRRDVVFWTEIQIPDKGLYYRVYVGRFHRRSEAVAFWNELNKEGAVSYFGVHEFSAPLLSVDKEASIDVPETIPSAKQHPPMPKSHGQPRFLDKRDGTVIDSWTGLMWVKNGWRLDFLSAVNWWEAKEKCRDFRLQGHSDWRLPTVEEWKSLIDPAQQHPALVTPHPFENIIAHMPYWTATDFTFSGIEAPSKPALRAYTVLMYYGTLNHQRKKERAFVLPVRFVEKTTP